MLTLPRAQVLAHGLADTEGAPGADSRQRDHAARVIVAIGLLTACVTTSVLSSNADPHGARLDLHGASARWICVDHQRVPVPADATGFGMLPPGQRVTIGADTGAALPGEGHCVSTLSFVPRAGQSYRAQFETAGGQCAFVVYRHVTSNRLGLGLERTQAPAQDCAER